MYRDTASYREGVSLIRAERNRRLSPSQLRTARALDGAADALLPDLVVHCRLLAMRKRLRVGLDADLEGRPMVVFEAAGRGSFGMRISGLYRTDADYSVTAVELVHRPRAALFGLFGPDPEPRPVGAPVKLYSSRPKEHGRALAALDARLGAMLAGAPCECSHCLPVAVTAAEESGLAVAAA